MSETTSFVDPVFLARFGLARANVLDYFLHPLNPFRTATATATNTNTNAATSNEVLAMQGISIGMLMQHGTTGEQPMTPQQAEEEYSKALRRLTGEQYELLPPPPPPPPAPSHQQTTTNDTNTPIALPSPLFTIRHVLRTSPSSVKVLGIYYVVEGIIYKSPTVRSVMKTHVARTLDALSGAGACLAVCARYQPSIGYTWVFERPDNDDDDDNENADLDPVSLIQLAKRRKRRKVRDSRRPGERTAAEEEGIRASEAIDQILVRLSKSLSSSVVAATTTPPPPPPTAIATTTTTTVSSTKKSL